MRTGQLLIPHWQRRGSRVGPIGGSRSRRVRLRLKPHNAGSQDAPFLKLTQPAAPAVHNADLPRDLRITVLFDAYCLCDAVADACLTHPALKDQRAQGLNKTEKLLRLAAISRLKTRMRQLVWQDAVEDVVKHRREEPVIRRLEKTPGGMKSVSLSCMPKTRALEKAR